MGQYWDLLNLDRQETLPSKGGSKMWEQLVNGTMEQLIALLRVPNYPELRLRKEMLKPAKGKQ